MIRFLKDPEGEQAVAEIKTLIKERSAARVLIIGPSGGGKTRVVMHVFRDLKLPLKMQGKLAESCFAGEQVCVVVDNYSFSERRKKENAKVAELFEKKESAIIFTACEDSFADVPHEFWSLFSHVYFVKRGAAEKRGGVK